MSNGHNGGDNHEGPPARRRVSVSGGVAAQLPEPPKYIPPLALLLPTTEPRALFKGHSAANLPPASRIEHNGGWGIGNFKNSKNFHRPLIFQKNYYFHGLWVLLKENFYNFFTGLTFLKIFEWFSHILKILRNLTVDSAWIFQFFKIYFMTLTPHIVNPSFGEFFKIFNSYTPFLLSFQPTG